MIAEPATAPDPSRAAGYMTQLDALRFFAVLGVIAAHNWQPEPLPWILDGVDWGELGVRLFFVLSGFLITAILLGAGRYLATRADRLYVLRQFYVRRFLRIFPIYYLVLVLCLIFAVEPARELWPWLFSYTTNVYIWQQTEFIPNLGHFWTLAVEEQFYLAWPLIVLFAPRRYLLGILLLAIFSALGYRLAASFFYAYDVARGESASSTLIFGVVDCLALGSLLALCSDDDAGGREIRLRRILQRTALPVGVACYLAMLALVHYNPGNHVGVMVGPLGAALVFCWLVGRASRGFDGLPGRLLTFRPLAYLGRITYGIYIFHLLVPVLFAAIAGAIGAGYTNKGFLNFVATGIVAIALAALSWHAFEAPLNRLKRRFPYQRASEQPSAASLRAPVARQSSP